MLKMEIKINIKKPKDIIVSKARSKEPATLITSNDILRPQETSELGESLQELNKDKMDKNSRMSSIDLRTRITNSEITGMLIVDTLAGFRVISEETMNFTLRKKRLNVSLKGRGREEIVEIVQGKQERESGNGFTRGIKRLFMGGEK